jgi:hypothetical protein
MTKHLWILVLLLMIPVGSLQADTIQLEGSLSAANQDGSDPDFFTDSDGIVPTDAVGTFFTTLDDDAFTLDFVLIVEGIFRDDLMNFGPNATPIHLHVPGQLGAFGPVAVDLTLGAVDSDYTDTASGFELSLSVSVLLEDQGNVNGDMHPGNDVIIDELTSGRAFALVHTTNPDINGFPFGEIRGNLNAVPEPSSLAVLGFGSLLLFPRGRRS